MHATLTPAHRAPARQPATKPHVGREAAVAARLAESGHPSLRSVRCESRAGVLLLFGTVRSYYLKQVAQTVAANTNGVDSVENQLEVRTAR